jgi:hypothetical protein
MGVIGCPNLGPEPAKIGEEVIPNGKGVLMVAVKGEGSYSVGLTFSAYCVLSSYLSDRWTRTNTLDWNYLPHHPHRTL